jgi:hypothetical protein
MDLEPTVHNYASCGSFVILTAVYAGDAPAIANPQVDGVRRHTYT